MTNKSPIPLSADEWALHEEVERLSATILDLQRQLAEKRVVTKERLAQVIYATIFGGTSDPTLDENAMGIAESCADALLSSGIFSSDTKGTPRDE